MTGLLGDGVGLAAVVGDLSVDEADDVGADGGRHDVGEDDGGGLVGGHVAVEALDGDERTCGGGSHFSLMSFFFSHCLSTALSL